MSGQTSPGSEYAYMYTPSDAQTPASDYSQSSGPASAAVSQAHTGPPSVAVQETVPEEPSWKEEESEEDFDGYVPAHLIDTGLPVQEQQSTNVQPQPSVSVTSPFSTSLPLYALTPSSCTFPAARAPRLTVFSQYSPVGSKEGDGQPRPSTVRRSSSTSSSSRQWIHCFHARLLGRGRE